MSIDLTTLNQRVSADAQATIAGIRSFKEYCDNYTNKLMQFLEGESTDIYNKQTLSFTHQVTDEVSYICLLTKEQYQLALANEEAVIEVALNNSGKTIALTGKEITESIEDNAADIKCQGEFLGYLLNNENVSSTSLSIYLSTKFQSMSQNIIGKYTALVSENNAFQSIKNFFELSKRSTPSVQNEGTDDEYIEVITDGAYIGGNPWLSAFQQIGETIVSFFNVVWQGISRIGEFFVSIINGITKLLKWFISKAFKPLSTDYEKISSKEGYLDYPIFQVKIATLSKSAGKYALNQIVQYPYNWNVVSDLGSIQSKWHMFCTPGYSDYVDRVYTGFWTSGCGADVMNAKRAALITALVKPLISDDGDGKDILRPYDIVIPSGNHSGQFQYQDGQGNYQTVSYATRDIMLRFGVDSSYNVYMQAYVLVSYEDWSNFNDAINIRICHESLRHAYELTGSQTGYFPNTTNSDALKYDSDYFTFIHDALNAYIDVSGLNYDEDVPTGLQSRFHLLEYDNPTGLVSFTDPQTIVYHFLYMSFLGYAFINGPAMSKEYLTDSQMKSAWNSATFITETSYFNDGTHWTTFTEFIDPISVESDEFTIVINSQVNCFRPYVQYSLYSPSVHYQTYQERVDEAKSYIFAAIIAAAAVFATIIATKFVKKRKIRMELAQARVDQYSWNIAQDPTEENISKYMSARKEARKTRRMNSILGISDGSAFAEANDSTLTNVTRQIFAMQGYGENGNNKPTTLTDIYDVITGRD